MLSRNTAWLLSLALLAACGKNKAPEVESATVARATPVQSLNPAEVRSADDIAAVSVVFERLTTLVKDDLGWVARPALAASWTSEDNGESWLFQVAAERVFSDGTVLDAAAIAASLNKAKAAGGIAATLLERVARVDATDEGLRLTLSDIVPDLPARLAHPALGIVSSKGLGSGPFNIAEQSAAQLVLKANENNPRPPAQFDRVVIKVIEPEAQLAALATGQILATTSLPAAAEAEPGKWQWYSQPQSASLVQLSFNLRKTELQSLPLRQALAQAIDYSALPAVVAGQATPLGNFMPPALDGYRDNQRLPLRNLPAAKAAIERIKPKPSLTLLAPQAMESLATTLVANFAEAGLSVTAKLLSPADYAAALAAGDYLLLLQENTAASPSSLSLLLALFADPEKQGRENFSGYASATVWQLMDSASISADPEGRQQLTDIAIREINKLRPVVPLYSPHLAVATANGVLQPRLNPFLPAALPLATLVREVSELAE